MRSVYSKMSEKIDVEPKNLYIFEIDDVYADSAFIYLLPAFYDVSLSFSANVIAKFIDCAIRKGIIMSTGSLTVIIDGKRKEI